MKKKLILLSSSVLLFFNLLTDFSYAQDSLQGEVELQGEGVSLESPILPPEYPGGSEPGFLGQDHSYTVVFRGNGEAVVSVRVVFTNKSDQPLSEINLRIPKVEPRDISVYQVIIRGNCLRYNPSVYYPETRTYSTQECVEFQEPDYYQTYYSNAKYQKAKYELDIDTLKITLPSAIGVGKSGSFFVYFRATGYVEKNAFGVFNFNFETLKAEDAIRNLRVGISTDSDLILRGAKGDVVYRFEEPALSGLDAEGAALTPQKSLAVDQFVNQIGQGRITKTASNLAALESYTVKGAYASSRVKLYAKDLMIALAVILLFVAILFILARLIVKRLKNSSEVTSITEKSKGEGLFKDKNVFFLSLGLSFISSVLIFVYPIAVFFAGLIIGDLIQDVVGYQYAPLFDIFLVMASFVVYAVFFLLPSIYMGAKKGAGWGILTIIFTVIWLAIFIIVAVLVLFLFRGSGSSGPIVPLPLSF